MTTLTRRTFLGGAGAAAVVVGGGLDGILSRDDAEAAPPKKRITFEEARSDPKKYMADYVSQTLEDIYGKEEVKKHIRKVKFFEKKEDFFAEYKIKTKEEQADIENSGMTIYHSDFGKETSSDLIIFQDILKDQTIKISGKTIPVSFNEAILRAVIVHEFTHAKDIYSGIKLSNGSEINYNNFSRINPEVLYFVRESRAFVKELEEIMKTENVTSGDLFFRNTDISKRGYISTVYNFVRFVFSRANAKLPKLLSPEEHRLMVGQLGEISSKFPEMLEINQVSPLYQKFGVK